MWYKQRLDSGGRPRSVVTMKPCECEIMVSTKVRRQNERERHRREIVEAALNCFVRKGFERATMAEVAKEAGFAVGTLYKFFADKQALYQAIILETATDFHAHLTAALEQPGSEIERIERYVDAKTSLFVKHKHIGALFFAGTATAVLSPTVSLESAIGAMYQQALGLFRSIFRRGIRKRIFADRNPETLFLLLEGLTNAFIPALVANPEAFTAEEMAAAVKSTFFDGIRR